MRSFGSTCFPITEESLFMRRSLSQSDRGTSDGSSSSSRSASNQHSNLKGGRVRRRPFPFSSSASLTSSLSSSSNVSSPSFPPAPSHHGIVLCHVLALGLDVNTLRTILCQSVPHYSSHNGELLAMLEGLFVELNGTDVLHQLVGATNAVSSNSGRTSTSTNIRQVEQLLGNVATVLACFLDTCTEAVPPMIIFHVHSILGQIRDLVLRRPDGALDAYLKALWLASWSDDIPTPCVARTLHRIGTLHASQHRYDESRKLLRQALATYDESGIPSDRPIVMDCHQTFQFVDAQYWATIGANEDSWSSLAGLSDRRVPLPRIREEEGDSGAAATATSIDPTPPPMYPRTTTG